MPEETGLELAQGRPHRSDCLSEQQREIILTGVAPEAFNGPEAWRRLRGWGNDRPMAELKSTQIAAALSSAMAERRLVRLTTRYDGWVVRGYVLGMGPGFVLVSVVNDRIWLDGFECFRRPDIIAIEDERNSAFIEAALVQRGETNPETSAISLASIEDLLETAGRAFRLVTIHCEEVDPEVCYIGNILEIANGNLLMREITPAAEWDAELQRHSTADITRVAFGADYEEALALVAPSASPG